MSTARFLSQADALELMRELLTQKIRLITPTRIGAPPYDRVDIAEPEIADAVRLDAPVTARSIKEAFLPPTEVLLRWRQKKNDVELLAAETRVAPAIVFGARPCDAAAALKIDKLMGWDYRDELWFGRRAATTIVSVACTSCDSACFCTAVGLGPDSKRGADMLLTPVAGGFHAEPLTDKGEKLAQAHAKHFHEAKAGSADEAAAAHEEARARVQANLRVDLDRVRTWLDGHFAADLWKELALRCHGCAACASVCPTCHCFDIVDEPDSFGKGARRRNWDTCQTGKFTLHGSGHNPRPDQSARYRQRVTHKFSIFPKRFGELLCTGCGRCVRACPGGMDLCEVLSIIDGVAKEAPSTQGAA